MYAAKNYNRSNYQNQYLIKEIMEATPQQLLIKLYDIAITNCHKGDMIRTNNAIQELINSLSFETPEVSEISIGLYRLYQFCQDQMRKGNTKIVLKILGDLRDSWLNAFNMKQ